MESLEELHGIFTPRKSRESFLAPQIINSALLLMLCQI